MLRWVSNEIIVYAVVGIIRTKIAVWYNFTSKIAQKLIISCGNGCQIRVERKIYNLMLAL